MEEQQDFREDLGKISYYLQKYFTNSTTLAKLEISDAVGKLTAWLIASLVVFTILGFSFLLLSLALLLFLAEWLESFWKAFLVTGLVLLGVGILFFFLRNQLFVHPIRLTIVKMLYETKS
jgi:hypothetical protein